ncbi:hypothetical protein PF011_g5323 [Phytophthora fragariae]|uniref:Uncharacterized protein n=2 Tax=Phytophthora TaxID=4783 RepID=A0A6A3I869_9STRA|nr:hypothetical protein PR002_g24844 [Phytophthora rubi]KAE9020633.1 hypothetical protein PF011_g5323 [Phytophthora fragariae]
MQSLWMTESSTVTHMDRLLGFYSNKTPVTKAMELMSEPKLCVCDSAAGDTKKFMLTKLDMGRPDAMRYAWAWELVTFAIEHPACSNYVRVFLVKNKVEATKKFEYFLVFFEKQAGRAARAGTKSDKEKKKAKRKASG